MHLGTYDVSQNILPVTAYILLFMLFTHNCTSYLYYNKSWQYVHGVKKDIETCSRITSLPTPISVMMQLQALSLPLSLHQPLISDISTQCTTFTQYHYQVLLCVLRYNLRDVQEMNNASSHYIALQPQDSPGLPQATTTFYLHELRDKVINKIQVVIVHTTSANVIKTYMANDSACRSK